MILFINTSQTDLIQIKLIKDDKVVAVLDNHEEYKQAELLLPMIDRLMKNQRSKIQDLRLVAVVSGPGAFSALRLGVITANTLAWGLRIPIIEVTTSEAEDDERLIEVLRKKTEDRRLKIEDQFEPVVPKYGKEPNITKARKHESKNH